MRLALAIVLAGCWHNAPPAPPRESPPAAPAPVANKPRDCAPTSEELPALTYAQRKVLEANRAVRQALATKRATESAELDRKTLVEYTKRAVEELHAVLALDPYNVDATYSLAGLYSHIDAQQCAFNLLARLLAIRSMRSLATAADAKFDLLVGKGQPLDPDFRMLRPDPAFKPILDAYFGLGPAVVPTAVKSTPTINVLRLPPLPRVPDRDDAP